MFAVDGSIVMHREGYLLEVAAALQTPSRLSSGLNGRQQERNEHADDQYDN
jgi:hypothetical protein